MPRIKYIAKGTRLDSVRGVGLMWEPGQVRNVTDDVAERLLPFADMWERVESKKPIQAEPSQEELTPKDPDPAKEEGEKEPAQDEQEGEIGLSQEEKPTEEPLPVIDFHGMDKAALLNFVETKYNERLDKRQSEETIRQKAIAIFSRHEMDNEAL